MPVRGRSSWLPDGPGLAAVGQTVRLWHDPVAFQQQALRRYGEPFTLRIKPIGELVVVADPETVLGIFRGDPETFRAGRANGRILPILDCQSLLLADGEEHRQRRLVLLPAFRRDRVSELDETVRGAAHTAMAQWPVGRAFPLLPSLRALTLRVILRAVIAVPGPAARADLAAAVTRLLAPASSAALWWGRGRRRRWSPLGIFERRRAAVHVLVRDEIRRRRRASEEPPRDILDILMGAVGSDGLPLDDEAMCDEVVTLLIAGHETTSIALAWTFERVLRSPAVLERARAAARDGEPGYLDALVMESLRSRPPLVDSVRTLGADTTICGHALPTDTTVMVSIPLVHQRADLYPEPADFRPERFLGQHPKPHEWVPFGGGGRRCIGAELATFEMRTVVTSVLAQADLRAARTGPEHSRLLGTALTPSRRCEVVSRQPAR